MNLPDASVTISVFSRAPVPGQTKRRLIPALGPYGAAELHKRMLRGVLEVALGQEAALVTLVCTPGTQHPFFLSLEAELGIELVAQQGSDLGERMAGELSRCLRAYDAAVIVGSDCPFIEGHDYRLAFAALGGGSTVAIGPSLDGGYYLLGLSQPVPALFSNMTWGSDGVFEKTRQRIESLSLEWTRLPYRADIDRPEDLPLLPARYVSDQAFLP